MKLAIASTFTAEPLQPFMKFWFHKLELDFSVDFAPYNQVFQQLLGSESLLAANKNGINLLIVRVEDWLSDRQGNNVEGHESAGDRTDKLIEEFSDALIAACKRNRVPHLLFLAPSSGSITKNAGLESDLAVIAAQLQARIGSSNNLTLITPGDVDSLYRPANVYDAFADKLGAIPYTEEYFAVMSAVIARKIYLLKRSPFKVVVCDCDNTLWDGIVGEDGPLGIQFSEGRYELQRRLVELKNAGKLVCLASKNIAEDVEEVFRTRTEMPLQRDDLTALRINWQEKFLNIQSLAHELGLGLDSFIFLDDNPVEIASVQSYFPQVLSLLIPEDPDLIPETLSHFWAFDTANVTEEDRKRTEMYRQNLSREELKRSSIDLQSFIKGLELVVEIGPMTPEQVQRVAQLTQRTNQFNATTIRRNEAEIMNFANDASNGILTSRVRDRFGDYGLVGVILYTFEGETLYVDTLLLSCRVLGRGVEHRLIAKLGEVAAHSGLKTIVLPYKPSPRNEVIKNFFASLQADMTEEKGGSLKFHIAAAAAGETTYVPGMKNIADNTAAAETTKAMDETLQSFSSRNEIILDIAAKLRTPQEIMQASSAFQQVKRSAALGKFIGPRTPFEEALAEIWCDLLKTDKVGIKDSFYELGGHSLQATMCLSRIRQKFDVSLDFKDFFAVPTIETIVAIIVEKSSETLTDNELGGLLADLEGLSNEEVEAQLAEYVSGHKK